MLRLQTELYTEAQERLPHNGKQIIGYQTEESIVVYQAYKPAIADFAVKHQYLGGDSFSYERMSWIKPGFLWMMYRCGWCTKADQERVIAIHIGKEDFKRILAEAVPTTFKPKQYESSTQWKAALKAKDVRIQWDPDHSPYGQKQERKAIQLGLSGKTLALFGKQYIQKIEDMTGFIKTQSVLVNSRNTEQLQVPYETVLAIDDPGLARHIGL